MKLGNVGNSQCISQEKRNGSHAYSVGCYYHIDLYGFSYDLQERTWHCSSTLLRLIIIVFWSWKTCDGMADMIFPVVKLENNRFQVSVDLNLYTKEVITAALYKFTHLYYVHQETDNSNSNLVQIVFESKEDNQVSVEVPKQFCNELIDQQIRCNTNIQFGHIRDLIVEEAFKPVKR